MQRDSVEKGDGAITIKESQMCSIKDSGFLIIEAALEKQRDGNRGVSNVWNGYDDRDVFRQIGEHFSQEALRVRNMLEHIEKQYEVRGYLWRRRIQIDDVDLVQDGFQPGTQFSIPFETDDPRLRI